MSNGAFNPYDDDNFITSDLQDHIILEEEDQGEQVGRATKRRRRDNEDDDDSDYDINNDDPNDSDFEGSKTKKRGRPPKRSAPRSSQSKNGSATRSGRIVKAPSFADEGDGTDDDDYDFGPKRKRGRPPSKPIPASSFKGVKENPKLPGSKSYQRTSQAKDRCNLCNLVLKTDSLIAEHIKNDHVLPSMNPDDMVVQKTGVKAFLCAVCGSSFDARIKFKFHKRSKHGVTAGAEDEEAALECDLCETIVENKGELVIHKDTKHGNLKTYHCDYCNDKYFTADDLVDHRRVMHEDQVNKIVEPWIKVKRTEDQVLKEMFPEVESYSQIKRKSMPVIKKPFPKRILEAEELPPSSPEKSPGNTSSSDYEPDQKDDDDDDFDPSAENSSKKKKLRTRRSSNRQSTSTPSSRGRPSSRDLSLESLGIEGLSREGLENFKSAAPEIQKKVMKLLLDKRGREAVLKKLQGNGTPSPSSSSHGPREERRKTTSVSALTIKLQATLKKLLEKKKPIMYDCPECPHRFASKDLLQRHEKSAHTKKPPPKPVFTGTCQICSDPIPNEKDYVHHLLSKHMTPDVDVLSVAAGILVKRVAKDDRKIPSKKRRQRQRVKLPPVAGAANVSASNVSNDGSNMGTHDVNSNDASMMGNQSKTTIEPVIDDEEDDDEPVIDDGEPVIDEDGAM